MLAETKACTLCPGSTGEGASYLVWESLLKGCQRSGTSELELGCTRKGRTLLAKAGALTWGLVKGGGPIPLSQLGPDILQVGLRSAVGLEF